MGEYDVEPLIKLLQAFADPNEILRSLEHPAGSWVTPTAAPEDVSSPFIRGCDQPRDDTPCFRLARSDIPKDALFPLDLLYLALAFT